MVYEYKGWILHKLDITLKSGTNKTIYFFCKGIPKRGAPCDMPDGYRLLKTKASGSGMPY